MLELAPAKINLGLKIPFRYTDGYHHIVSLFIPVSLADRLQLEMTTTGEFELSWQNHLDNKSLAAAFDNPKQNLMYKAFEVLKGEPLLAKHLPSHWGLKVHIDKHIPSPAGLGGGSSDAGAIFRFVCNQTDSAHELLEQLQGPAQNLGADIPFFLFNKAAIISGIGEIHKFAEVPRLRGIIGIPPYGFATGEMYRLIGLPASTSKKTLQGDKNTRFIQAACLTACEDLLNSLWAEGRGEAKASHLENRLKLVENDFLPAIKEGFADKYQGLSEMMTTLAEKLAEIAREKQVFYSLSGSGSAFFALFVDQPAVSGMADSVHNLCEQLTRKYANVHWLAFES